MDHGPYSLVDATVSCRSHGLSSSLKHFHFHQTIPRLVITPPIATSLPLGHNQHSIPVQPSEAHVPTEDVHNTTSHNVTPDDSDIRFHYSPFVIRIYYDQPDEFLRLITPRFGHSRPDAVLNILNGYQGWYRSIWPTPTR